MMDFNEALIAQLVSVATDGGDRLTARRGDDLVRSARSRASRISTPSPPTATASSRASGCFDPPKRSEILAELGLPASPTHGHALDKIFERVVEPHLVAPTFVTAIRS